MPMYPLFRIATAGVPERRSGRKITRAVSGDVRARDFYGSDKRAYRFEHKALTASELATLDAFYSANRNGTFDFYWPPTQTTLTGMMFDEDGYQDAPSEAFGCFDVTVKLVES